MYVMVFIFTFAINGDARVFRWQSPESYSWSTTCEKTASEYTEGLKEAADAHLPENAAVAVEHSCEVPEWRTT